MKRYVSKKEWNVFPVCVNVKVNKEEYYVKYKKFY